MLTKSISTRGPLNTIRKNFNFDKNSINRLPEYYFRTHDLPHVAEELWGLLLKTVSSLNHDVDTVHDFCVYFYEKKLATSMELYQYKHNSSPFMGFITRRTKYEFYNYIRSYRRREIKQVLTHDVSFFHEEADKMPLREPTSSLKMWDFRSSEFIQAMECLSNLQRVLLKLFLGLTLNIAEWRQLVQAIACPMCVERYIHNRLQRSRHNEQTQQEHFRRIAQLSYLLNSSSDTARLDLLRQRKKNIQNKLLYRNPLRELTYLSKLFCVGKSTIFRRINQALTQIYKRN